MDQYRTLLGMALFAAVSIIGFDEYFTMREALHAAQADVTYCVVNMNQQVTDLEKQVQEYLGVYHDTLKPLLNESSLQ